MVEHLHVILETQIWSLKEEKVLTGLFLAQYTSDWFILSLWGRQYIIYKLHCYWIEGIREWVMIFPFRLLLPYEKFLLAEQKKLLGIGSPKPSKTKVEPGEPSVSILQVSHVWYCRFFAFSVFSFSIDGRYWYTLLKLNCPSISLTWLQKEPIGYSNIIYIHCSSKGLMIVLWSASSPLHPSVGLSFKRSTGSEERCLIRLKVQDVEEGIMRIGYLQG